MYEREVTFILTLMILQPKNWRARKTRFANGDRVWHHAASTVIGGTMPTFLNYPLIKENLVAAARIGDSIFIGGIQHRVCITEDGRKIAHPWETTVGKQAA